jgi:hypothetical protein
MIYITNLFIGANMTNDELESLSRDIVALRKAVRKANPFLRSVVEIRDYAILSLPLGILIIAFCLVSQFLVASYGSFEATPPWWKAASWVALALFLGVGAIAKWRIIGRRAAETEQGATFFTAVRAMYGGAWANMNLPILVCIVAIAAFAILVGHPWYIIPAFGVFMGLACNAIAVSVEAREYLFTGWYSLTAGLLSLFFIEGAPFIWTAVVIGGLFLVYGFSGIARSGRSSPSAGAGSGR